MKPELTMRQQFLRGYIFALAGDGELRGARSPGQVAAKVTAAFARDLTAASLDLVEMASVQVAGRATEVAREKIGELFAEVAEHGIGAGLKKFWKTAQEDYKRGLEVLHGPPKRRSR